MLGSVIEIVLAQQRPGQLPSRKRPGDRARREDGCIDGSLSGGTMKFTSRIVGQSELTQGEMKFKLTFKTNINTKESEKELADK